MPKLPDETNLGPPSTREKTMTIREGLEDIAATLVRLDATSASELLSSLRHWTDREARLLARRVELQSESWRRQNAPEHRTD